MSNNTKKLIILTAVLLLLSGLLSGLRGGGIRIVLPGWNRSGDYSRTYPVNGKFQSVTVETDTGKVSFSIANDGKARVIRSGNSRQSFSVSVFDGRLTVKEKYKWPWYLGGRSGNSEITVYLPEKSYKSLNVRTDTGSVSIHDKFRFEKAEIDTDTGTVQVSAVSLKDDLKVETDTGSIHLADLRCDDLKVKSDTGSIRLSDLRCEDLSVKSDTGSITMKNVVASDNMEIKSSTGRVDLDLCDAGEISIHTDTGQVKAVLLSDKEFIVKSDTGRIDVPVSGIGGKCKIETDTGSITVSIK